VFLAKEKAHDSLGVNNKIWTSKPKFPILNNYLVKIVSKVTLHNDIAKYFWITCHQVNLYIDCKKKVSSPFCNIDCLPLARIKLSIASQSSKYDKAFAQIQ